jgi:hypothetical protein
VKKGGPDVAMKMALEIPDSLIQAGVARTLRLNRGETDSKDHDGGRGGRRRRRTGAGEEGERPGKGKGLRTYLWRGHTNETDGADHSGQRAP